MNALTRELESLRAERDSLARAVERLEKALAEEKATGFAMSAELEWNRNKVHELAGLLKWWLAKWRCEDDAYRGRNCAEETERALAALKPKEGT